jgi:hypothetical protein
MEVEILYFDGCPNVTPTVERLDRILAESGLNHRVTLTRVGDLETAQSVGILGSPTIRINGVDIEAPARMRTDFGIMCRTYDGTGVPSEALIRNAIREAQDRTARVRAARPLP